MAPSAPAAPARCCPFATPKRRRRRSATGPALRGGRAARGGPPHRHSPSVSVVAGVRGAASRRGDGRGGRGGACGRVHGARRRPAGSVARGRLNEASPCRPPATNGSAARLHFALAAQIKSADQLGFGQWQAQESPSGQSHAVANPVARIHARRDPRTAPLQQRHECRALAPSPRASGGGDVASPPAVAAAPAARPSGVGGSRGGGDGRWRPRRGWRPPPPSPLPPLSLSLQPPLPRRCHSWRWPPSASSPAPPRKRFSPAGGQGARPAATPRSCECRSRSRLRTRWRSPGGHPPVRGGGGYRSPRFRRRPWRQPRCG